MKNTRALTIPALLAAAVFVVTWTCRVPIPATNGGYVNLGDTIIYIAAYIFGGPTASVSAALGSLLADLMAGAPVYAPATFVIKGLMGLVCGTLMRRGAFGRYAFACLLGGVMMTAGYALYELILFGAAYAVVSIPYNLIQFAGSVAVAAVLYPIVTRLRATIAA